jgi:DNA repair protein RecN (Recombination protein N)
MLTQLYIKDFALIDELEVQFDRGLSIITGQTGAGKSIIIGAFNMVLGERADTDVIRNKGGKAIAEATLKITKTEKLHSIFTENELEWQDYLVLRREIKESGSRAFVNDSPVPIHVLKSIGDQLVDLHGQHDHQLLLKDEHHREFLDAFTLIRPVLAAYQSALHETKTIHQKKNELLKADKKLRDKEDLYRFQLNELNAAELFENEEEELIQEMSLLDNAEVLEQKASSVRTIGSEGEVTVLDLIAKLEDELEDLVKIDSGFEQFLTEMQTAKISINELMRFTESYIDKIEFNPERLEKLRLRQSELKRLQKKYHASIPELIALRDDLSQKLSSTDNLDIELEKLEKQFQAACKKLSEAAQNLREIRQTIGADLSKKVEEELANLGIKNSRFEVRLIPNHQQNGWITLGDEQFEAGEFGSDSVLFYISTNKGMELKPLSKTASGGEISRVMLALKSIFAQEQSLPLMIFDEIDTGISGEISEKVGRSMRKLAGTCQILCITHQPQIASYADNHYKVVKSETETETQTKILRLNDDEHVREVASLMSGEQITKASMESAKLMIQIAKGLVLL